MADPRVFELNGQIFSLQSKINEQRIMNMEQERQDQIRRQSERDTLLVNPSNSTYYTSGGECDRGCCGHNKYCENCCRFKCCCCECNNCRIITIIILLALAGLAYWAVVFS